MSHLQSLAEAATCLPALACDTVQNDDDMGQSAEFDARRYFAEAQARAWRTETRIPKCYWGGMAAYDPAKHPQCRSLRTIACKWIGQFISALECDQPMPGLYFCGKTGCGKSRLAASIGMDVAVTFRKKVRWWGTIELFQAMRDAWSQRQGTTFVADIKNCTLLIVDDLGAERVEDWIQNQLYDILNARIENNRTTIYTSNLAPDELRTRLNSNGGNMGDRLVSRIVGSSRLPSVPFPPVDFRMETIG